jgi:hypothetical protein
MGGSHSANPRHGFIATSFAEVLRRPVESALDRPVKPGDDVRSSLKTESEETAPL